MCFCLCLILVLAQLCGWLKGDGDKRYKLHDELHILSNTKFQLTTQCLSRDVMPCHCIVRENV